MKLLQQYKLTVTNKEPCKINWKPLAIGVGVTAICVGSLIQYNKPRYEYIHVRNDDVDYSINANNIRWIREKNDCLYICTKKEGCALDVKWGDTSKVCKDMKDYDKVKRWID